MASGTYNLFEQAMVERKQITCIYEGGYREICPHILGHRKHNEVALTYQFAGTNSEGRPVNGEWKCLYLSKVRDAQLREGPWRGGSEHSQNQNCVNEVDLDVNPESPYKPKRQVASRAPGRGAARRNPLDGANELQRADGTKSTRDAWIRALEWTSTIAANPTRLLADVLDEFAPAHTDDKALLTSAGRSLYLSELAGEANRYSRWALQCLGMQGVASAK